MIFTWACFIATAIPAIAMLWGPPWSPGKTAPLIFSSKSYMIFLPSAPVDWTPKKKQAQKGNSKKRVCWSIQYEIYRSNGWFRVKKQGNDFLNKCDLNVPLVWPCTATYLFFLAVSTSGISMIWSHERGIPGQIWYQQTPPRPYVNQVLEVENLDQDLFWRRWPQILAHARFCERW